MVDVPPLWRSSSPTSIEDDLKALWQEAAREAPVAYAIMSNLVIVASGPGLSPDRTPEPRDTLVRVAERHPARIILIDHHTNDRPREPRAMRAGLLRFGPHGQRYGVEVIGVATTCADASLPSVIRGLARGDVPTSVWFGGDLSANPPASALLSLADQFVYESGAWHDLRKGFRALAGLLSGPQPPTLIDLTWRQLADMRAAIGTALEPLHAAADLKPDQVHIDYGEGHQSSAWLLWGWLATSLDWPPRVPAVAAAVDGVTLRVRCITPSWSAEVVHDGDRITVHDTSGCTLEVSPTFEPLAHAVADSLLTLVRDRSFEQIVRTLSA